MVWALHRKVGAIPGDGIAKQIPALVHAANRSYPYFQLFQQLMFSIPFQFVFAFFFLPNTTF
jgi:hypothetical protein